MYIQAGQISADPQISTLFEMFEDILVIGPDPMRKYFLYRGGRGVFKQFPI